MVEKGTVLTAFLSLYLNIIFVGAVNFIGGIQESGPP